MGLRQPELRRGTYSYNKLVENINGKIHSFPGRYSTDVVAEQARGVIDGFEKSRRRGSCGGRRPRLTTGSRSSPTTRPHAAAGRPVQRVGHPGTTGLGEGQVRQPDHARLRDAGVGLGRGGHSDKPYYLRKLPELTPAEKDAETNVTRQRAESLYALDVQIRQTFAHLRTLHQLRNTVIVFTSDNGYYLGEHLKRTGKVNLHEPSLRVPLLVVGPGVPHGRRYDPVTTVDLAPTFAAYAGTAMPGADGTSLLPTDHRR